MGTQVRSQSAGLLEYGDWQTSQSVIKERYRAQATAHCDRKHNSASLHISAKIGIAVGQCNQDDKQS